MWDGINEGRNERCGKSSIAHAKISSSRRKTGLQGMARIAIGGFQHETNTFAPSKADYAAFEAGGGWPGVQYGEPIFSAVEGTNIPAAGAIQVLRAKGHTLVGTAWAAASPSAHVTADAFERITGELVSRLKQALPRRGVPGSAAPWWSRPTKTAKARFCAACAGGRSRVPIVATCCMQT
jgi:hypothetical protein